MGDRTRIVEETSMMSGEAEKKEEKRAHPAMSSDLPPGKVRCYISKEICDEDDTVELDYNGVRVKVHKRYARA
jgi:hypothetical protein